MQLIHPVIKAGKKYLLIKNSKKEKQQ